jgi:hypothetical protein
LTALDHLKGIGGVPNKVTSDVFPSLSHQSKAQILSGFRFLGLIDDDGVPQGDMLSELALKDSERKTLIHTLIELSYPDIVALDFARITPSQLDQHLSNDRYNISGDTKKKAKTFLLKAAQFAGFTVSPLLTKITRNRRKSGERKPAVNNNKGAAGNGENGTPQGTNNQPQFNFQPPPPSDATRTPIPLGLGRTAYLELPKDWKPSDLKKLIGILKLSLEEDSSESDKPIE